MAITKKVRNRLGSQGNSPERTFRVEAVPDDF